MYNNNFYKSLNKPAFTPPAIVFQSVWIILYILMAISFFIVLKNDNPLKNIAITVFVVQLALNFLWSPVFFIVKKMKLALLISFLMFIFAGIMVLLLLRLLRNCSMLFLWH